MFILYIIYINKNLFKKYPLPEVVYSKSSVLFSSVLTQTCMLAHVQICKFKLKTLFWNAEVFFKHDIISDTFLSNLFGNSTEWVQLETGLYYMIHILWFEFLDHCLRIFLDYWSVKYDAKPLKLLRLKWNVISHQEKISYSNSLEVCCYCFCFFHLDKSKLLLSWRIYVILK